MKEINIYRFFLIADISNCKNKLSCFLKPKYRYYLITVMKANGYQLIISENKSSSKIKKSYFDSDSKSK